MAQWIPPQSPNIRFRVLIIGRANAGKTSILQRLVDTTESPEIYRLDKSGKRELVQLHPSMERGEHDIENELIFTKHDGYVFHDSRGFEADSEAELRIVQEFDRKKSLEKQLEDRLHAIWYCIPMDSDLPGICIKHFNDFCTMTYVPVIAVFTKYDQFRLDICMKIEDENRHEALFHAEVERIFYEEYLAWITMPKPFVRTEKMHKNGQRCTELIEVTANALRNFPVYGPDSETTRTQLLLPLPPSTLG